MVDDRKLDDMGIPAGWQPADWLEHLKSVRDRCAEVWPDAAEWHQRRIDSLERWLAAKEEP